jgi:3-deoxy-D-manno-octulosonic-acid transferase
MAVFIKYEFWMNYLIHLKKRNIPTYIISAIFRPNQIFFKSYADGYKKVLRYFDWFFVQDQASKDLLEQHNMYNNTISGDTRFDRVYEIYTQRKSLPVLEEFTKTKDGNKAFTLIAGSSWPKDEDLFISYFNAHPNMKLIIAPHEIHKEHLESIISKLRRPYALYSETNEKEIGDKDCLIIDCFGLLSSIYRYGEIAYIGGGFGAGIHNILEAAVYGIPVIFGPNYKKFREARELIELKGGFSIVNATELNELIDQLSSGPDQELLHQAGKIAGSYVCHNIGATDIILSKIREELNIEEDEES